MRAGGWAAAAKLRQKDAFGFVFVCVRKHREQERKREEDCGGALTVNVHAFMRKMEMPSAIPVCFGGL